MASAGHTASNSLTIINLCLDVFRCSLAIRRKQFPPAAAVTQSASLSCLSATFPLLHFLPVFFSSLTSLPHPATPSCPAVTPFSHSHHLTFFARSPVSTLPCQPCSTYTCFFSPVSARLSKLSFSFVSLLSSHLNLPVSPYIPSVNLWNVLACLVHQSFGSIPLLLVFTNRDSCSKTHLVKVPAQPGLHSETSSLIGLIKTDFLFYYLEFGSYQSDLHSSHTWRFLTTTTINKVYLLLRTVNWNLTCMWKRKN